MSENLVLIPLTNVSPLPFLFLIQREEVFQQPDRDEGARKDQQGEMQRITPWQNAVQFALGTCNAQIEEENLGQKISRPSLMIVEERENKDSQNPPKSAAVVSDSTGDNEGTKLIKGGPLEPCEGLKQKRDLVQD